MAPNNGITSNPPTPTPPLPLAMAATNGNYVQSTQPPAIPSNGTQQIHHPPIPSNGAQQRHHIQSANVYAHPPVSPATAPRPMFELVHQPPLVLEVGIPIAKPIWGKIRNLCAIFFSMFLLMAGAAPRPLCILCVTLLEAKTIFWMCTVSYSGTDMDGWTPFWGWIWILVTM